ncbi:MAG: hypothetical protein J6Z43_09120 [Clostridiales bacterium]|nr:hypothetical protein [Clostridiales bacterium]
MKIYFDEETDKRLMEAKTKEEIQEILASVPGAGDLVDRVDLVMAEIEKIKGSIDEEVRSDELDSVAGGSKVKAIYLGAPGVSCASTFSLNDLVTKTGASAYCFSNDQCYISNEYEYHFTKFAPCPNGGDHNWYPVGKNEGVECRKCKLRLNNKELYKYKWDD